MCSLSLSLHCGGMSSGNEGNWKGQRKQPKFMFLLLIGNMHLCRAAVHPAVRFAETEKGKVEACRLRCVWMNSEENRNTETEPVVVGKKGVAEAPKIAKEEKVRY